MAGLWNSFISVGDKWSGMMSKSPVKEACAEFFGTFVLVVLGDGVMANCILGRLNDSVIVAAFGWGLAVMIAVAIARGVSGGHVNPAITTGLASIKKCPFKHMIWYIVAQYIGSFLGSAVVYSIYIDAIELYDGGVREIPPSVNSTAQIFATYPQDFTSPATCFLDQVVGTAVLLIIICTVVDSKNQGIPSYFAPMIIGLGIAAIIFAFGHNCGAPLNPARDLAPRVFTAIAGWGKDVFSYRNYNWFWIPVIAPHVGGLIGTWLYQLLIEMPSESRNNTLPERDNVFQNGDRQVNESENLQNSFLEVQIESKHQSVAEKVAQDVKAADTLLSNATLPKV